MVNKTNKKLKSYIIERMEYIASFSFNSHTLYHYFADTGVASKQYNVALVSTHHSWNAPPVCTRLDQHNCTPSVSKKKKGQTLGFRVQL